jgi:peptidyl-Asp metalloendopeptidase
MEIFASALPTFAGRSISRNGAIATIAWVFFVLFILAGIASAGSRAWAGADDWQVTRIVVHLGEASIVARRTSLEKRSNGSTWRGEIEGTGEPVMIMRWKGGRRFSGMLTYRGDLYTLKTVTTVDAETHATVESSHEKMPAHHAALHSEDEGRGHAAAGRALAAQKVTIDVMVLYTRKVASKYLDVETDVIAHSIEEANASFVNSDIDNIKLRLVHSQQIAYDESEGEHFNHLYRMVDGEGAFANVAALRNEKRADVVVLIVDDASGCGLATRVAADAEDAFAVVHHACAVLTYSIPHEIGHIIGARHDSSLDRSASPFPYGHGYVNGTKWRDIMSYKASCDGCPRLALWSNPTVMVEGEPAGTAHADNARVILEQAERVSKFR